MCYVVSNGAVDPQGLISILTFKHSSGVKLWFILHLPLGSLKLAGMCRPCLYRIVSNNRGGRHLSYEGKIRQTTRNLRNIAFYFFILFDM